MVEYRGDTYFDFAWVLLFCAHAAVIGAPAVLLVAALRRRPLTLRAALVASAWGGLALGLSISLALVGVGLLPEPFAHPLFRSRGSPWPVPFPIALPPAVP